MVNVEEHINQDSLTIKSTEREFSYLNKIWNVNGTSQNYKQGYL